MVESYLSVVRRRWRLVLVLALAFAAVVFAGLTARSGTYTSSAVVQVASNDVAAAVLGQSTGYQEPEQRLATELETFRSRAVAARAADRLRERGVDLSTDEVQRRITASARGVSLFLEIEGRADTAELAREITSTYIDAYTNYRRELQRGVLERLETDLRSRLAQAESELVLLEGQPDGPATSRQRGAAAQRYETATDLLERVRLRLSLDTSGVSLASEATLPGGDGSVVAPELAAVVAALAGLVAAVGGAMLVDLVRDPVRSRREVELLTGLVPLGALPPRPTSLRDVLVADDAAVAAARGLRQRLDMAGPDGFPRPLVVRAAAAQAAEGSYAAVALAGACAAAGMRTLLIADPDATAQLAGSADPAAGLDVPHGLRAVPGLRPGLWLLSATSHDGSRGLADTPSPSKTLRDLAGAFDAVVVVDAGTMLDGYDGRAVSVAHGGALLVCVVGRTTSRWLTDEVDGLGLLDDVLVSVVLVGRGHGRAVRRSARKRMAARGESAQPAARGDVEPGEPTTVAPEPTTVAAEPTTVAPEPTTAEQDAGATAGQHARETAVDVLAAPAPAPTDALRRS